VEQPVEQAVLERGQADRVVGFDTEVNACLGLDDAVGLVNPHQTIHSVQDEDEEADASDGYDAVQALAWRDDGGQRLRA